MICSFGCVLLESINLSSANFFGATEAEQIYLWELNLLKGELCSHDDSLLNFANAKSHLGI